MRRIVLVGFMGCGKSTVGPLLADLLGWRFHDVDRTIEEAEGRSVEELFRERGEEAFRALETATMDRLLGHRSVVLAPGGGWGATPGRLEALPPETLSVWLRVSPGEAVRRIGSGDEVRPLLGVDDPEERARSLLRERESRYGRADLALDTERVSPEDLARTLAERVRSPGEPS